VLAFSAHRLTDFMTEWTLKPLLNSIINGFGDIMGKIRLNNFNLVLPLARSPEKSAEAFVICLKNFKSLLELNPFHLAMLTYRIYPFHSRICGLAPSHLNPLLNKVLSHKAGVSFAVPTGGPGIGFNRFRYTWWAPTLDPCRCKVLLGAELGSCNGFGACWSVVFP